MRPLALALGGILAALLAVAVAGALASTFTTPDYTAADLARIDAEAARYELERARAERQLALMHELYWLDGALAAAWRIVPLVAVAGAGAYLAARGVASARFRRDHIDPDSRGLVPVPNAQLGTIGAQALGAYHAARQLEAQQQPVPHTLTYAPHTAPRLDYRHHGAEGFSPALLPADVAPANVPSFAALLDAGKVGRGNPMLLGYDAASGEAVEGSWLDLYSCGLGGLSGSGKSWTATYLAAQAALFGTRIVLLDPHAEHAESLAARLAPLSGRFLCAPAESPREMLAAVELVAEELRGRKGGRRGEPLLFIADEYSALQRGELADPLGALVEALGQEGRKLGLYAMAAGQVWTASRAGGTEVRDSLASAYVHRCRPSQARYLTGMTAADLPGDLLELPAGTAYLLNTSGDFRKVTIPRMGAGDVQRVADLLDGSTRAEPQAAAGPAPRPMGFVARAAEGPAAASRPGHGPDTGPARATAAGSATAPLDAEAAGILARMASGATVHDLAAEMSGTSNPGDRRYKAARERVEALLRQIVAERLGKGAARG